MQCGRDRFIQPSYGAGKRLGPTSSCALGQLPQIADQLVARAVADAAVGQKDGGGDVLLAPGGAAAGAGGAGGGSKDNASGAWDTPHVSWGSGDAQPRQAGGGGGGAATGGGAGGGGGTMTLGHMASQRFTSADDAQRQTLAAIPDAPMFVILDFG